MRSFAAKSLQACKFFFFFLLFLNSWFRYSKFAPPGSNCWIDVNGDGESDTVDQAVAQADAWGRYFVLKLRQTLGRKAVILANAGGENGDPYLNGLTVEMGL